MKAVISGATRGIGKAIAHRLAKEGYDLVLIARNEKELENCKLELEESSSQIETLAMDLASKTLDVELTKNARQFENVTVLVNNLGVYSTQSADQLDLNIVQQQIELNLYSAIQLTQFILPNFKSKNDGLIINIGSKMSIQAEQIATDYSISKHAFKAWNDGLREVLRKENIKVSAIYPGAVNTSSWDGLNANTQTMIQAEDIAEVVSSILKMSPSTLIEEIRIAPKNFEF